MSRWCGCWVVSLLTTRRSRTFRKDNGLAVRKVCARFVELCRELGLLTTASVAIDGSKFKAVNNPDKNFTKAKVQRRRAKLGGERRPQSKPA
jgi:transposase